MTRVLFVLTILSACLAIGCTPSPGADKAGESAANPTPAGNAPAGDSNGVQVMPSAAGGMAPVTGAQNIQGDGGFGVGSAAKDMARNKAAGGGSSLDQLPVGDE